MATTYIHFTEEQKDQARRTDLRSSFSDRVKRWNDPDRNTNGITEEKRSRSGEICGLISMNQIVEVAMLLHLPESFNGLDFPEAVKFLLEQQGVVIPPAEGCTGEGEKVLCPSSEE